MQDPKLKDNAKAWIILLAYPHQQHLAKTLVQRALAASRSILQLLQPVSSRDLLEALEQVAAAGVGDGREDLSSRVEMGFDRDSGSGAAVGIGMVAGGPDGSSAGKVPSPKGSAGNVPSPKKKRKKKRKDSGAAKQVGEELRVLVVDDVKTNRVLLDAMLKR